MSTEETEHSHSPSNSAWNIIKNPVNGRTRISQACDRCRARKIKCSGKSENSPKCTNCEKDGFQCVVSDKLTRNSFPKGYTKNLEKRLLDIELQRNKLMMELKEMTENYKNLQNTIPELSKRCAANEREDESTNNKYTPNAIPEGSSRSVIKTDTEGVIHLWQNLKSPFDLFMKGLTLNTFNGYENTSNSINSKGKIGKKNLSPQALKTLKTYHLNLNRYLNLVLHKLIFPLFNLNSKYDSNKNADKNLDHLIWLFFNDYNKLIPILDFELFYNDYLTFVNTYTLKNSTYTENGEMKRHYYEFNSKEQDIMMKIILILKFTLCQPKSSNSSLDSSILPDKNSMNQLNESVKFINTKHIMLMFKNTNFMLEPNMDKLEISLLTFYYLVKFENYNLPEFTDSEHTNVIFLRDVINSTKYLLKILNIDKSNSLISIEKQPQDQLIKIHRLKLYWDYKILIKLAQIYFCLDYNFDDTNFDTSTTPSSMETIKLINDDVEITLTLIELLEIIPINIMELVVSNNREKLTEIDQKLQKWKENTETITNDENNVVFNKLKSYYSYFKVLINLSNSIDGMFYVDYIGIVYDLTFNNSKNPKKPNEISIETAESLCLHSFNFHLICLISMIKLKNITNKELCLKMSSLIQLYQIMITFKEMDPAICTLVNYIKDNVVFNHSDATYVQDETLKLFASLDASSVDSSLNNCLFNKNDDDNNDSISFNTNVDFDLNAFILPGDDCYSVNGDNGRPKRRKSSSSANSYMSSNFSLGSRESSVTSARRMSISSNDSVPSLFPSATSPFPSESLNNQKRRSYDYSSQNRINSRMASMSSDSRLRRARTNSNGSIQNRRNSTHSKISNDDELSSLLDNNYIDPTVTSISMSHSQSGSIFKKKGNVLPTIPSEGNLMKAMVDLNDCLDPMDIDEKNSLRVDPFFENVISDEGSNFAFTKEFKKLSTDYSIFSPSPISSATSNSNSASGGVKPDNFILNSNSKQNSLIDDNDMIKLKERVINLKSSTA